METRGKGMRNLRSSCGRAVLLGLALVSLCVGFLGCGGGAGNRRNVVLIVPDTVRADHLGLYGYGRPTSPELDRWAESGAVFDHAFATSPWTLPSFASIYTGQLPSRHSAGLVMPDSNSGRAFVRLDPTVPTLAEILAQEGYATGAVINNPFLHAEFGVARGFETYDYVPGNNEQIRRADVMVNRALGWLDGRDGRPFFLLVHLFDPHMNYDPPISVRGRFTKGYEGKLAYPVADLEGIRKGRIPLDAADREFIIGAYDEELLFVDIQLGRLLEGIRSRGLLDDTVVVLVSDHGEEFFDHGGFEHGHTVYQELLHVPMVVWGPDVRAGRIADPVSIADLYPTILDALELPRDSEIAAESLWKRVQGGEPPTPRSLVAEGNLYGPEHKALLRWPHKVIVNTVTQKRWLYDLAQDPSEKQDLAGPQAAVMVRLLSELQQTVRTATRQRIQKHEAEIPAETREQLRALGYLD
jgi:arylsulfatase A-like enzyme